MDENNYRLSNDVTISAKIEGNNLSFGAKSRAISAFDRLIGSVFDIAASAFEGYAERIRAQSKKKLQEIENPSEFDILGIQLEEQNKIEQFREFENKKIVMEYAVDNLSELSDDIDMDGDIPEEWMTAFIKLARDANSDRLRDIWGRVLSGEIKRPGQFSVSTLRFIAELDAKIAELFQKYAGSRFADRFLVRPKELKGQLYDDLLFLEEVGLLNEVSGKGSWSIERSADGLFFLREGNLLLSIRAIDDRQSLNIGIIFVTRIGREIASILPKIDAKVVFRAVAEAITDESSSIEIGDILNTEPNDQWTVRLAEKLK